MDAEQTVTVYSFRLHLGSYKNARIAPCKAPREVIEKVFAGDTLEGTAQRVRLDELDDQGCYRRIATGWGLTG